ncbi:MAG: hypothetical protein ACM3VS_13355 [Candidatus Dadabacteria bacterium]
MNKSFVFPSILFVLIVIAQSCSKNSTDTSTPPANSLPSSITAGTGWSISNFSQRGEDKTSAFQGFVFYFNASGSISAKNNSATTNGSWTYTPSAVGYYGSTPSKASFTISIGNAEPLSRLTKTWNIDSTATTSNRLVLLSPEVLENETVIFSKQ